jgi:hypothetical protein
MSKHQNANGMNTAIKNNKNTDQETYIVPTDVMLEIAQIILQADLPHEIIGAKEHKRQLIISIYYQSDLKFHQEAIKNIVSILDAYKDLCDEENGMADWLE